MKNFYHKNNGKIYPSSFAVLNLLPAAITALISILSFQDREVLAYLITREMKTTNPFSIDEEKKKKKCRKIDSVQKIHVFECGCFDCYTGYWFRWDSSPNRELIHQAIEAFEEHLADGEISRKKNGKEGKKKEKMGRRRKEKSLISKLAGAEEEKKKVPEKGDDFSVGLFDFEFDDMGSEENSEKMLKQRNEVSGELKQMVEEEDVQVPASSNRGLMRKVLPDVMGLFNSRLWRLWNPTV